MLVLFDTNRKKTRKNKRRGGISNGSFLLSGPELIFRLESLELIGRNLLSFGGDLEAVLMGGRISVSWGNLQRIGQGNGPRSSIECLGCA